MKKSLLLTILSLTFVVAVFSQPCLPGGIGFTSQAQIDNFPTNYPNCSRILGPVDVYGEDITNLDSLIYVTKYDSWLTIRFNEMLNSISGLGNVTSIGVLDIAGDNELTDLSGLENLDSLGSLKISETDILRSLDGLNNVSHIGYEIEIRFNEVLSDLTALSNVGPTIGGITFSDNDSLLTLSGLEGIHTVNGGVYIFNSYGLNDLTGLDNLDSIGGGFWLVETSLTDISSLSGLSYVGEETWLSRNYELTNFSGLDSLVSIGGFLIIDDNDQLTNLSGLGSLTSIDGDMTISSNAKLSDISGIQNISAQSISSLSIRWNPVLSECAVESICEYLLSPNGDTDIRINNSGCNSVAEVEEDCLVGNPSSLFTETKRMTYPNPAADRIFLSKDDIEICELTIFNRYGQKVLSADPSPGVVDVSSLSSGVYFVEIDCRKDRFMEKIIIK